MKKQRVDLIFRMNKLRAKNTEKPKSYRRLSALLLGFSVDFLDSLNKIHWDYHSSSGENDQCCTPSSITFQLTNLCREAQIRPKRANLRLLRAKTDQNCSEKLYILRSYFIQLDTCIFYKNCCIFCFVQQLCQIIQLWSPVLYNYFRKIYMSDLKYTTNMKNTTLYISSKQLSVVVYFMFYTTLCEIYKFFRKLYMFFQTKNTSKFTKYTCLTKYTTLRVKYTSSKRKKFISFSAEIG